MKYFIPVIFKSIFAIFFFIMMVVLFCLAQIAYTLWTFKFRSFNKDWNNDKNFWEYDDNGIFEKDPAKIYPSVWHWVASALPKKVEPEISNKEPFLNS